MTSIFNKDGIHAYSGFNQLERPSVVYQQVLGTYGADSSESQLAVERVHCPDLFGKQNLPVVFKRERIIKHS